MPDFSDEIIEALSIDTLIFGFDGSLKVLLIVHEEGLSKGKWALPGGWIKYNESLNDAAHRILQDLTGVNKLYLEQLQAFGSLSRFPNKRVVTIAYYALVRPDDYKLIPGNAIAEARWFPIDEVPTLPYDHDEILSFGLNHIRHYVKHAPIGFNLLPQKFTLSHLQQLYEAILGVSLDKPNFRRKIMKMNLLTDIKEKERDVAHRAAKYYSFDRATYEKLQEEGFNFEF